jgi:hypothetical protein
VTRVLNSRSTVVAFVAHEEAQADKAATAAVRRMKVFLGS